MPPPKQNCPRRNRNGMKKCQKKCVMCLYIKEGKYLSGQNFKWYLNTPVNCQTTNIVYMIQCSKDNCQQKYIGESERSLKDRLSEHIGYIKTSKTDKTTGRHFNLPGHSLAKMTATVLEKVKSQDIYYRKERESYLIRKFNTFHRGLNLRP